jgi:hypothetical protein
MGLIPHCMMMKAASKEHTFQVRKAVVLEAQRKWNQTSYAQVGYCP